MKDDKIDWTEQPLQRWIGSIVKPNTRTMYQCAYRLYHQYTGLNSVQLIDEALEDAKKDPREKIDIVKQRLIGFYNWLENEAPRRQAQGRIKITEKKLETVVTRFETVVNQVGKGVSSKSRHLYIMAVRSFYGSFDIYIKLKGRSKLPKARVKNKRMLLNNLEVKKLVDNARSLRDRAIILTLFQSGIDVSTLCSLKYGNVVEGFAKKEHPLMLELRRGKSGVDFYTFLGKDAVEAIQVYLNDARAKGLTFNNDTPLFLKEGYKAKKNEGLRPNLIEKAMKELAIKSGFVDGNNNGKDFNPLNPHALRESFGSIMTTKGVPETVVDLWLGHEIGEMSEAYKSVKFEDVKQMYLDREQFISISTNGSGLEQKLKAEIEEKGKTFEIMYRVVTKENDELKDRVTELEKKMEVLNSPLLLQRLQKMLEISEKHPELFS